MNNKDRRVALEAAASVFCAADVPASEVIEHAQAFEEYLAGGPATLATDSEFTESRTRLLHQLANFVRTPGHLGLANWLRSVAFALELNEPWQLPDQPSEKDVADNAKLNLLVRLREHDNTVLPYTNKLESERDALRAQLDQIRSIVEEIPEPRGALRRRILSVLDGATPNVTRVDAPAD